jgi:N6-L-threonylcarbamoyladenine synthase
VRDVGRYERLGTTLDDALGEAFDKTAKMLGLGYPGGPAVEQLAREGNAGRFEFPRPMLGRPDPHFSFAGLKTAVRQTIGCLGSPSRQDAADLCASFEAAVTASVIDRVRRAMVLYDTRVPNAPKRFTVAGGVAANARLRAALQTLAADEGYTMATPPSALCADNAAMIAWAGAERLARGRADGLDTVPRARWPLDEESASVLGAGKLGAKA